MNIKKFINSIVTLAGFALAAPSQAITIDVGTYSFTQDQIADQLVSGNGYAYNGITDYKADQTGWYYYDAALQQAVETPAPGDVTDAKVNTFLANESFRQSPLSLELAFNHSNPVNAVDSNDLVLFFLWDQSGNSANITINDTQLQLTATDFKDVYSAAGTLQTAKNVEFFGTIHSDVQLSSVEIDLNDFGLLAGAILTESIHIEMQSFTDHAMALSMVASLNTTPVPLPAPLVLFGSGLIFLSLFRKKSNNSET